MCKCWYNVIFIYFVEVNVLVCKDVIYEYFFIMDVDLDFYWFKYEKFIGWEWFLNELDEKMVFFKCGVLFLVEMGYGKLVIVVYLIC